MARPAAARALVPATGPGVGPGKPGPSAARRAALAALLLAAVAACRDASDGAPVLAPARPGDSLFEHLRQAWVLRFPETNLPPPIARVLADALADSVTLAAERWQRGPDAVPAGNLASLFGTRDAVPRWNASLDVPLDLAFGTAWLEHDGRPVQRHDDRPGAEQTGSRELLFFDDATRTLFAWKPSSRSLVAFGVAAPGVVRYGFTPRDDGDLSRFEWRLVGRAPQAADARPLRGRLSHGGSDRRCLDAPASTTVSFPLGALEADGLRVEASVLDVGFALEDGALSRVEGRGDGVLFAVDVEHGGGTTRAWSRHVRPGQVFVADTVDLAPWRGEPVALRLVTEPGAPGDAAWFDYAAWSGLRLTGGDVRAPDRPHVVLVDVDTLRADALGAYGNPRDTSPRLDAWAAAQAVVFTDALAVNDWTLPATASMLTGLAPSQHGVRRFPDVLPEQAPSLAELLGAAGYETWARTDAGFVSPVFGFARGFDRFDFARRPAVEHERLGWSAELERLAARGSDRPVFLFLHTYHVHAPYPDDRRFDDGPAPYDGPLADAALTPGAVRALVRRTGLTDADRRHVRAVYEARVRRMDAVLGAFLEQLDGALDGQPALVIVTSDHGEELAERDVLGHGHSLYRELLHVPLVVRFPDGVPRRVTLPVSQLDVAPTVLAAAGLPVPGSWPGRALAAAGAGDGDAGERPRVAQNETRREAIEWQGWRLLRWDSGERRLFELAADPGQRQDRAGAAPDRAAQLEQRLEQYLREHDAVGGAGVAPELPAGLLDDLRALGYLEGAR